MRRQQDVARIDVGDGLHARFERCPVFGMVTVEVLAVGERADAVGIHDLLAIGSFATAPAETGAARRMTGCGMHLHRQRTHAHHAVVGDAAGIGDGRERLQFQVLRIVAHALAAAQDGQGGGTRQHPRAAQLLQLRDAAGVVEMLMRVEDDAHVAQPVAAGLDAARDPVGGLFGGTIDQDMALGRRDQDGGDPATAHVPGIAEDMARCGRLVPVGFVLARYRRRQAGGAGLRFDRGGRRAAGHGQQREQGDSGMRQARHAIRSPVPAVPPGRCSCPASCRAGAACRRRAGRAWR